MSVRNAAAPSDSGRQVAVAQVMISTGTLVTVGHLYIALHS